MHYKTEAARLTNEINLWERWTAHHASEHGFQDWLNEPFLGQAREDAEGAIIAGSMQSAGQIRRAVLVWNYQEISDELDASLS